MNPACPACGTPTASIQLQEVPCFECGHCKGHLIRGEALDSFLTGRGVPNGQKRLLERALQSAASTRNLTCPACRAQSYRVVSSGFIAMDVCDLCAGLYLDQGEANAYLLQTRATTNVAENTVNAVDNVRVAGDVLDTIFRLFH